MEWHSTMCVSFWAVVYLARVHDTMGEEDDKEHLSFLPVHGPQLSSLFTIIVTESWAFASCVMHVNRTVLFATKVCVLNNVLLFVGAFVWDEHVGFKPADNLVGLGSLQCIGCHRNCCIWTSVCGYILCVRACTFMARVHMSSCSLHSIRSKETKGVKMFPTKTSRVVGMVVCVCKATGSCMVKPTGGNIQELGGAFRNIVATQSTFAASRHTLDTFSSSLHLFHAATCHFRSTDHHPYMWSWGNPFRFRSV